MNEKIRELAEQATIKEEYYPAGCNGYPEYRYDFNHEHFAELIVRECAEMIAQNQKFNWLDAAQAAKDLKIHFGVE
jgi:hypothetical protein